MEVSMKPIGVIHSPFQEIAGMPIQSSRSNAIGTVEIFPEFKDGLDGVEDFSHLYLIYVLHQSEPVQSLKVQPFLDDQFHGIFATRYPVRPNSIGLSVIQVLSRQDNMIHFKGADMLDETPLLDIKPYIPEFDIFSVEKTGWYQNRKFK
jgi:tRNA-Thr(GGU) m(6)t(6)A37 methyltransferase TsaA